MARLTPKMFSLLNEDHIYKLHNKKIFTVLDFVSEDLEKLKNITELPVLVSFISLDKDFFLNDFCPRYLITMIFD